MLVKWHSGLKALARADCAFSIHRAVRTAQIAGSRLCGSVRPIGAHLEDLLWGGQPRQVSLNVQSLQSARVPNAARSSAPIGGTSRRIAAVRSRRVPAEVQTGLRAQKLVLRRVATLVKSTYKLPVFTPRKAVNVVAVPRVRRLRVVKAAAAFGTVELGARGENAASRLWPARPA